MINKEIYAREIIDVACEGNPFGVNKKGYVASCLELNCKEECIFAKGNCVVERKKWCNSGYIGKTTISENDRRFLDYIPDEYKWIARDRSGLLCLYYTRPTKEEFGYWKCNEAPIFYVNNKFKVDFDMIKWNDDLPWLIEDLKKLEVKNIKKRNIEF